MKTKLSILAIVPLFFLSSCYYSNYERLASTGYYYPDPPQIDTVIIIVPAPHPHPVNPKSPAEPSVPIKYRPESNFDNNRKSTNTQDKTNTPSPSRNNNTERNSGERNNTRSGG